MGRDAKTLRACEARATLEDHAEARATLEDHAYGASRLPKQPKTTVLQSKREHNDSLFDRQFKVAYYSFIRVQEVYTINVQI